MAVPAKKMEALETGGNNGIEALKRQAAFNLIGALANLRIPISVTLETPATEIDTAIREAFSDKNSLLSKIKSPAHWKSYVLLATRIGRGEEAIRDFDQVAHRGLEAIKAENVDLSTIHSQSNFTDILKNDLQALAAINFLLLQSRQPDNTGENLKIIPRMQTGNWLQESGV